VPGKFLKKRGELQIESFFIAIISVTRSTNLSCTTFYTVCVILYLTQTSYIICKAYIIICFHDMGYSSILGYRQPNSNPMTPPKISSIC